MKRKYMFMTIFGVSFFVLVLCISYAFLSQTLTGTKNQVLNSGTLRLDLKEENEIKLENALPVYDEVGMIGEPFVFSLTNTGYEVVDYVIRLVDIDTGQKLDSRYVRYGLVKDDEKVIDSLSNLVDNRIDSGFISKGQTISYELRLWIDSSVEDESLIHGKSLQLKLEVETRQRKEKYVEKILNGAEPVLSENLIPVTIENDGTVRKADIKDKWYSYEEKEWANAVVLEDRIQKYKAGEVILESAIQSYFVWIPKYRYQLWDLGNYNSVTTIDESKVHTIPIQFGLEDTNDINDGECATPGVSGETGNCKVGDFMTHPAFQAFDSTGFWVGKFESGYKGAANMEAAQVNSSDYTKLIIKPNVYSWRSITVGNAFKTSYDYLRSDDSHMMKNTEWGAVAYLQHSEYGSHTSVRINNNGSLKTGYAAIEEPTLGTNGVSIPGNQFGTDANIMQLYNTKIGYTASTTGNISGIYDMSGGTHEHVMGYNINASSIGGSSNLITIYKDFFTSKNWNKYYDQYDVKLSNCEEYNVGILGDATREMGPFELLKDPDEINRRISSWYKDYATFLDIYCWFGRGGAYYHGTGAGIFFFNNGSGDASRNLSFRIVLTPKVGD